jgi:hypothetical protein
MASMDIDGLQGDYIAFEKLPRLASNATKVQIRMIDPEDNQYSLSLPQHGTWFVGLRVNLRTCKYMELTKIILL